MPDIDCDRNISCRNAGKSCFKCFDYSFYEPFEPSVPLQSRSSSRTQKKPGFDLERRGVNAYNRAVSEGHKIARQQPMSGALPFALGDMITEEYLTGCIAEFKERGSLDSSGKKQITIKKEWLDKLKEEALQMKKDHYFLPFSFKGTDEIYVVMDYNIFLSYVQFIQFFIQKNDY